MQVKAVGSLTLSITLYRYLICLQKFYTRELKMYSRLCFRRYQRDRMRQALANSFYSYIQMARNWEMVLRFDRRPRRLRMKAEYSMPTRARTLRVKSSFLRMKVMMALPQFLGMFLDSLTLVPLASREYSSSGRYDSEDYSSCLRRLGGGGGFSSLACGGMPSRQLNQEAFFLEAVELSQLSFFPSGQLLPGGRTDPAMRVLLRRSSWLSREATSRNSEQYVLKQRRKVGEWWGMERVILGSVWEGASTAGTDGTGGCCPVELQQNRIIMLQFIINSTAPSPLSLPLIHSLTTPRGLLSAVLGWGSGCGCF